MPILFTVICLLLKKSLFIAKLVVYISSVLGVGGIAGALNSFGGLNGFFGGSNYLPHGHVHGHGHAGAHFGAGAGVGLFPGKNTVFSQYDQDELQHNSPYKRQDRKVVFEKTRENAGRIHIGNKHNVRSTATTSTVSTPVNDRFYDYEKQVLMQDRSGKLRHGNGKLGPSAYEGDEEEVAGVISVAPSHRFKTTDSTGWKVINVRV